MRSGCWTGPTAPRLAAGGWRLPRVAGGSFLGAGAGSRRREHSLARRSVARRPIFGGIEPPSRRSDLGTQSGIRCAAEHLELRKVIPGEHPGGFGPSNTRLQTTHYLAEIRVVPSCRRAGAAMPQTRGGKRSYAEVVKAPLPAAAELGPSPHNPGGRPSSLLPLSRPDETVYAALVSRHMRFGLVLGGAHSRIALAIVEGHPEWHPLGH